MGKVGVERCGGAMDIWSEGTTAYRAGRERWGCPHPPVALDDLVALEVQDALRVLLASGISVLDRDDVCHSRVDDGRVALKGLRGGEWRRTDEAVEGQRPHLLHEAHEVQRANHRRT